jgi:transcriptional regulator with XRE-family HTH domain
MTGREMGLRLTRVREARGLTTVTLGQKVGLSQAQISRLENGKRGLRSDTLRKLSEALNVPPFFFLMSEDEWETYQAGLEARGGRRVNLPGPKNGK